MTEARTDPDLLYVGTYTENIYLVRMDRRSGELLRVGAVNAGANPSFLSMHPNGRVLYAVNELEQTGLVSAFAIESGTGTLTRLNEQPSQGGAPCYVSVDRTGRGALVANYGGGSVALLPIEANGALAPAHVVQHTGKGPNTERQEAPHAHCILPDPSNRFALAADLGADRVFVYRLDLDKKSLSHVERGYAVMRPGAGPRHLAFHPRCRWCSSPMSSIPPWPRCGSTRRAAHCHHRGRFRRYRPGGLARITPPTSTSQQTAAPCTCRTAATTASRCSP